MDITIYLIGVVVVILTYFLYSYFEKKKYWARRGIHGPQGLPIVGNYLPVVLQQISLGHRVAQIYDQFKNERFIGTFNLLDPMLLLTWPEDIEDVMVKNFSVFPDRNPPVNEKVNPHGANLFGLSGSRWRALRSRVTPTFTTGKIKAMIPDIASCWKNIDKYIQQSEGPVEMKNITSTFAMDVIACVAFGIDPEKLGNPDTEFRLKAKEFFNFNLMRLLRFMLNSLYPKIVGWVRISLIPKRITDYFADITHVTMTYRRKNNIQRNDFLQQMMELQDKGQLEMTKWDSEDDYLKMNNEGSVESIEITDSLIVSQAVIFFSAGFESTANTILFTFFEINQQPHILEKVTKEVESVIENHGRLTYEALKDMVYLEQCIQETLRVHPVIFHITRKSSKEYTFPNSELKINAGAMIGIPIYSTHMNEKYWPNPTLYNPDRFAPDKVIVPGTYLPFGLGPRMCIAMRFAKMEIKVALSKLLLNYTFEMDKDTETPIRSNLMSFLNSPISPVYFSFKRKHSTLL